MAQNARAAPPLCLLTVAALAHVRMMLFSKMITRPRATTADAESGSIFETITLNLGGLTGGTIRRSKTGWRSMPICGAPRWTLCHFMPLASADPNGGVIITDWYNDPSQADERFKVNVVIERAHPARRCVARHFVQAGAPQRQLGERRTNGKCQPPA